MLGGNGSRGIKAQRLARALIAGACAVSFAFACASQKQHVQPVPDQAPRPAAVQLTPLALATPIPTAQTGGIAPALPSSKAALPPGPEVAFTGGSNGRSWESAAPPAPTAAPMAASTSLANVPSPSATSAAEKKLSEEIDRTEAVVFTPFKWLDRGIGFVFSLLPL